jgi:hypothetical protein
MISRRGFLQGLLAAAPAALIVPELLIPTRTIFLPPAGGWVASEWSVSSLGGYLYSQHLANVLRRQVQPLVRFKQFQDNPEIYRESPLSQALNEGLPPGKPLTWDVWSDVTV